MMVLPTLLMIPSAMAFCESFPFSFSFLAMASWIQKTSGVSFGSVFPCSAPPNRRASEVREKLASRDLCLPKHPRPILPGPQWLKTRSVVHYNQDEGIITELVVWPTIQILLSAKGLFLLPRVRLWQPHCLKPISVQTSMPIQAKKRPGMKWRRMENHENSD